DLILLMDVLEHVEDDVGLLFEYVRKTNVGTTFLLSVPAFQFMWSGHDIFLEHKRRYTLAQIEQVAKRAGLEVERGCYYFAAVFPIAATTRLLEKIQRGKSLAAQSQLRKHHPLVNNVLKILSLVELAVMRFNRCFGLTAFCVAVKKRENDDSQSFSTK
ncbi:MAG: class I SAM-dependent methyltransferase, partial [Haliea sp.]|nr:class I SAM-dependent methyltransferase [Haliea sp.]